jgi:hypothetical protein
MWTELVPDPPALWRERLKPPQRKRKAPQTARGFNSRTFAPPSLRAERFPPPEGLQSAQADFVWSLRRIMLFEFLNGLWGTETNQAQEPWIRVPQLTHELLDSHAQFAPLV